MASKSGNSKKKDIMEIAYEKYQMDWMFDHDITVEEICTLAQTWSDNAELKEVYTFSEYIEEVGFKGEIWCCFDEFAGAEYLDRGYMEYLLNRKEFERYGKAVLV